MKRPKITMQSIADEMNISKATVSKALNNQKGVSDDLRSRIMAAAQRSGYGTRRASAASKIQKLAYIVPKRYFFESEKFYTTIYYYLNKRCFSEGIHLFNFIINSGEERSLAIPEMLKTSDFDGVFIAGDTYENYLSEIHKLAIPTVYIDFYNYNVDADCVLTDNLFISYMLTEYLIKRGHTKIGYVGEYNTTTSYIDRFLGYRKALIKYELPYNEDWTFYICSPKLVHYTLDFDLPGTLPTAFICQNDMDAHFLIEKLISKGYRVPEDVSVASFDNTEIAKNQEPPLTSVDIDKKNFAETSFNLMMNRIDHMDAPPQKVFLNIQIVERDSVLTLVSESRTPTYHLF